MPGWLCGDVCLQLGACRVRLDGSVVMCTFSWGHAGYAWMAQWHLEENLYENAREIMATHEGGGYYPDLHEIGHNLQGGWTLEGLKEVGDTI